MILANNNLTVKQVTEKKTDIFVLKPDTPLYKDMSEIKKRKNNNKIKLYTHQEVWGERI